MSGRSLYILFILQINVISTIDEDVDVCHENVDIAAASPPVYFIPYNTFWLKNI